MGVPRGLASSLGRFDVRGFPGPRDRRPPRPEMSDLCVGRDFQRSMKAPKNISRIFAAQANLHLMQRSLYDDDLPNAAAGG